MPADLTRFDFHAMRFLNSESVEAMSAEEIGQYILLLAKAWVVGKDTSLPNDPTYLTNVTKSTITERVLKQFPVVDTPWGPRRRNEVLYNEWLAAAERSESKRKAAGVRWENERNADEVQVHNTCYAQTKPSQAEPNQVKSNQDIKSTSTFRNITIRYRAAMKKNHSKSKFFQEQYARLCAKFGEDSVLTEFDGWAENNIWRNDKLGNTGLRFFFQDLPEMIEESREVRQMEKSEEIPQEQIESMLAAKTLTHELLEKRDAELAQEQIQIEASKANPNAF